MENKGDRKKFIAREIEKGNLQRAYEVTKETRELNMKVEHKKGAATLKK